MASCGIDFGTTNSLISYVVQGKAAALTGDDGRPHPSVVWYHGNLIKVGRDAVVMLDDRVKTVSGEFVRSPKSLLGKGQSHYVGGRVIRPVEAAAEVFRHLREHANRKKLRGIDFSRAVVTIPVDMRGSGRREVREAAQLAGITIEQFVHEPFAALYGYAQRQADPASVLDRLQNRLALVFDWGGGTLDLTICERVGDMLVQVQNKGNSDLGGDRFDERLMHAVLSRHAEKHGWQHLPEMVPGQRARLVNSCEQAKITLSSSQQATVLVRGLFAVKGGGADLEVLVTREELMAAVGELVDAGLQEIDSLLQSAGLRPQAIELCIPTGGLVAMPAIRDRLLTLFGPSRFVSVDRADTLIADGAAWIAAGDIPLKLAKNIEFRHADQTWVPVLKAGQPLPRGQESSDPVKVTLYCADPRNGFAGVELARPKRATRIQAADPRQAYTLLRVDVQPGARPLLESIELTLTIDPDLIVQVSAVGNATGVEAKAEIHELEFGVGLAAASASSEGEAPPRKSKGGPAPGVDDAVVGTVNRFLSAQQQVHGEAWLHLNDRIYIDGVQESLYQAVQRIWIDEYGRPPDSVVTLLQTRGIPCVRDGTDWVVARGGEVNRPQAPEAAPFGPPESVVLRSNVTRRPDHWEVVPGPLVWRHQGQFLRSPRVTERQRDELRWDSVRMSSSTTPR